MIELLLSFVFFLAVVTAMAIGVIFGRAPISGTCGGLNKAGIDGACEICGGDTNKCEVMTDSAVRKPASDTFYDASHDASRALPFRPGS